MLNYFPKYFTSKAITLYVASLIVVNIIFMSHMLNFVWWLFGLFEVGMFFYFANQLSRKWSFISSKSFIKKLFITAAIIRIIWVIFSYFFYMNMNGTPYEFWAADVYLYEDLANYLANNGFSAIHTIIEEKGVSDSGYAIYLGTLYTIFGNGPIVPRIIKALLGAFAAVLIYKLATRNFGENVGRMSGIFYMLWPNLIYYTGSHLKEAEMIFLVVLFIERTDYILRTKTYSFINIALPTLAGVLLFFFRTPLGAAAFLALFTTLIFTKSSKLNWGRRILLSVWVISTVTYFIGGKIATEIEQTWETKTGNQKESLEWRAKREGGNEFAKYASGAVFAPMIFVIPFPTMVNIYGQDNQQLINGGNYVKNIMAFFTIFALFLLIKEKKWREHLLLGSFTIAYLGVIAMSAFAQSERFHQPALPFILVFAAYGISRVTNSTKKYFTWWLVLIFIILIGWSWFKLAGRGLV